MKKIFLIVSLVLCLVFLVSCVENKVPDTTQTDEKVTLNNSDSETEKESEKETEKVVPYDYEKNATIEKQVLVDENGIKITALEIDYSGSFGPKVEMLVENNSSHDVMIQARNSSVNGAMVEANFTFDIIAGESRREDIGFAKSGMELYGIKAVETLEFGLLISDAHNWETIVSVDSIRIDTSAEKTQSSYFEDFDTVLYDKGGIKLCLKKTPSPSTPVGTKLTLGIENKSERQLKIQASAVTLDNASVSCSFSGVVLPGKNVIDEMSFSEWELKSLNVHDVKEMTLKFVVTDPETKETVLETETVTVSFE